MGLIAKLTGKKTTLTKKWVEKGSNHKNGYGGARVNPNNENCCDLARTAAKTGFLSKNVPMLPLNGCNAAECQCTYELFDDRRTDFRRTSDVAFDIASQLCAHDNRSETLKGRRSGD